MYYGTLKLAEHPERNLKSQNFFVHPMDDMLIIGQDDNLIYQLTDEIPEKVICIYELGDGLFANYAEDGEYIKS